MGHPEDFLQDACLETDVLKVETHCPPVDLTPRDFFLA